MVCDAQDRVVYVNASLLAFFTEAQEDFRIAFPGCSAKDMLGKVMEGVQREPRAAAGECRAVRFALGRRTVSLSLTPGDRSRRQRLGTAVEWLELTDELAAAAEVAAMVSGRRSRAISRAALPLAGKPETLAAIADGMNQHQRAGREARRRIRRRARRAGRGRPDAAHERRLSRPSSPS